MNTKKVILELIEDEKILAISIGGKGWASGVMDKPRFFDKENIKEALKILDFEFNPGYGGEEGYEIYVWTKTKIIVKGTYDGSEWYEVVPRNPNRNIVPSSIGG